MNKKIAVILLLVLAAGCSSTARDGAAPPMDPSRTVSEQDCSRPVDTGGGNLMCREVTEAERRRLEAEAAAAAALKAQQEREAREKAEAEALARQRAEQEAREAAARECRRLEQESSDGRAALANFVATYGKVDEFKGIAGQITVFLDKARKPKPCPPA